MEIASGNGIGEEREEGEIVEDDLEDVSDCSMSSGSRFFIGKSVSPPELLSAVCLSSVSSSDYGIEDARSSAPRVRFSYYEKDGRCRVHKRKRRPDDQYLKRKRGSYSRHQSKPGGSDTDSTDEVVDPKYAKKLRVALTRESSDDLLHNSLRTRLKAFIETSSHSEEEVHLSTLRDLALLSTLKSTENLDNASEPTEPQNMDEDNRQLDEQVDSNGNSDSLLLDDDPIKEETNSEITEKAVQNNDQTLDPELRELRIAALKSFILENHNKRRRRKAAIENHKECNDDAKDTNKENDTSIINNDLEMKPIKNEPQKNGLEVAVATEDLKTAEVNTEDGNSTDHGDNVEEDEDILRAMLLASVSTKLAGKSTENNSLSKHLELTRTLSDVRKVEKSKINNKSLSMTISKPFLRTIKNDLYSLTNKSNNTKPANNVEQPQIPTNVVVKPLIINVNADSDSDTENVLSVSETNKALKATVTEFLKKQRAQVEASVKRKPQNTPNSAISNKSYDPLMETSAMKLLPQSQQLEYRRLKQQLINARRRTKSRKLSQRLSESKREIIKKVPKVKTDTNTTNNSVTASSKIIRDVQEKKIVEPTGNLQKALNDLQIRKNGRLQMKGKYRSLAPLMHRINQASNERRQHEIEIKKLLLQIQKSRTKLASSHQIFTTLVQQLLCEKKTIDQRVLKLVGRAPAPFTSTPNNLTKKIKPCSVSLVIESVMQSDSTNVNQQVEDKSEEINSKNLINVSDLKEEGVSIILNDKKEELTLDVNESRVEDLLTVKEEELLDANEITNEVSVNENGTKEMLFDPNDIVKAFAEQPIMESSSFLKYTSPLHNRDGIKDPLTTFCPYDLLGVCKDKECRYMHCS